MGFWQRLRGKRSGGAEQRNRSAPPRPPAPGRRLFLDAGDAEHPVDLRGELEVHTARTRWRERLAARIAEALLSADEAERSFLQALHRDLDSGTLTLPTMPRSVLRVQELVDSPDCGIRELASEVELDPALSTKLVGIANSPFYAGLEPVHAVRDALTRIGLSETRNIVMAIALRSKVFRVSGFERETAHLWHHAVAASVAARAVAAEQGLDPDAGFLAGLVHDVGRAVLLSVAGGIRARSHGAVVAGPELLGRVLDSLHAVVSALVAESWRFTPELVEALGWHHAPDEAEPQARPLARVLELADRLARSLVADAPTPGAADPAGEVDWTSLGFEPETVTEIEAEIRSAYASLSKAL